jgi:hypothetical protein
MQSIKIGTDPEVFIADEKGVMSAIGLVGGTKDSPDPVPKGALQEDNVLAEFNVEPADSVDEFVVNINTVMDALKGRIGKDKHLVIKPSHTFSEKELSHPQAREFGCDADFNAWTRKKNTPPNADTGLRTAGGHVHIGYENPNEKTSYKIVQLCDYLLGLPSVILDPDQLRRSMYGAAGACRVKVYGVEYRTLSNFWLQSEEYTRWIYNTSVQIPNLTDNLFDYLEQLSPDELQRIINSGDVEAAKFYCDMLNINYPKG